MRLVEAYNETFPVKVGPGARETPTHGIIMFSPYFLENKLSIIDVFFP